MTEKTDRKMEAFVPVPFLSPAKRMSEKQYQLLRIICDRNADMSPKDLDQILTEAKDLKLYTSKAAIQHSIRSLMRGDFIRKRDEFVFRRERQRVCFDATKKGEDWVNRRSKAGFLEVDGDEELNQLSELLDI
jgi:hypothetical protein